MVKIIKGQLRDIVSTQQKFQMWGWRLIEIITEIIATNFPLPN